MEYSTVYHPPEELQIPDSTNRIVNESNQSRSESTISSNSDTNYRFRSSSEEYQGIGPDLSGRKLGRDSKSSSTTITPVGKSFPK